MLSADALATARFGGVGPAICSFRRERRLLGLLAGCLPCVTPAFPRRHAAATSLASMRHTQACRRPSLPPARLQRMSARLVSKPGAPGPHRPRRARRRGTAACAAGSGRPSHERALETHLSHLDPASRALLLSQAGPYLGRALTVFPTSAAVALPPAHLLLRRRPTLAVAEDTSGDHRSACARLGLRRPKPSHPSMQLPRYAGKQRQGRRHEHRCSCQRRTLH